jgi:pSer/pThr/pTyr-binding forkhead associated (FHA) protein
VCFGDDTVSARHARLSYHHNQWWVEDLQSRNGTYLNDERVSVPTVIVSGDELRYGQVATLIEIDEKSR